MPVNNYVYSEEYPTLMKDGSFSTISQGSLLKGPVKTANSQPNSPIWETDIGHDHWQRYREYPSIDRYQLWELTNRPFHRAIPADTKITKTTGYDETHATTFAETLTATIGAEGLGMSASVTTTLELTQEDTQSWHEATTVKEDVHYDANMTYCLWTLFDVYEVTAQLYTQYEKGGNDPQGYLKEGDPTTATVRMAMSFYQDSVKDPGEQYVSGIV